MIKFRNPGSNKDTQIQIMRIVDSVFYGKVFTLDDFSWAVTNNNLMTAYGYSGESARSLSNVEDESRNSIKMNAKMYAEVFRMLGWLSSFEDNSSYPLIVTELGHYVATSPDPDALYRECIMGINSPQEMMEGVRYNEQVRFFLCALDSLAALDGHMYKHELCMGPMSVSDIDSRNVDRMLDRLRNIRGSYAKYKEVWREFCSDLGMKQTSVDNQTRFPVGALYGCGWVEDEKTTEIYPPKSLKCLKITTKGIDALNRYLECKDLRLNEFKEQGQSVQDALIRVGFHETLKRAGYDISPIAGELENDRRICETLLNGQQLLFSPYQTLKASRVNSALGVRMESFERFVRQDNSAPLQRQSHSPNVLMLDSTKSAPHEVSAGLALDIKSRILEDSKSGLSSMQIVRKLFDERRYDNQDKFYPLIGALFELLGYDCFVSRQGDNGARWDAIITSPYPAIPIEIKSPGEEEHISLKAIKQALENKIILLSRETYSTSKEATSLAVGYKAPNDRAEVSALIGAFYDAYGFSIGVLSLEDILSLVVAQVVEGKGFDDSVLTNLRGFVDVKA